jgi:lysophospholipase L1-like esterase
MTPVTALDRIRRSYTALALIVFNCLLIVVVLNVVLSLLPYGRKADRRLKISSAPVSERQGLMEETWGRSFGYEPFTTFKERAFSGRYVNVDDQGFRRTFAQGPWPPDSHAQTTVFVFGGSTTFGYGVADDETIPSHLARILLASDPKRSWKVYNFGRAYYYSTQERILFEQLVTSGTVPDLVVFIDGLNDFRYAEDEPEFSGLLQAFIEGRSSDSRLPDFAITRATERLAALLPGGPRPSDGDADRPVRPFPIPALGVHSLPDRRFDTSTRGSRGPRDDATVTEEILARYARNKRIIDAVATSLGVPSVSVWQPVPNYKYDLAYYQFEQLRVDKYLKPAYERMAQPERRAALGKNFVWCADVFESMRERMYVDRFHYTSHGAELVARCVAKFVEERGLLAATRR